MLEARGLSYGFPGRTIGAGISFGVAAGETLCVLGPNGGGKTTLFRTLLGLLGVHAGEVLIAGADAATLTRRDIAKLVGYVPQAHAASFGFTINDIVLMGRTVHLGAFSPPGAADRRIALQALQEVGIAHLAERIYTAVSGGERQLALIARALAQQPKVLIMDEPTASLDFGNQMRVLDKLRSLATLGIATLFSTHDPDHAFVAADRALLLGGGRMLALGDPHEVLRPQTLEALYGIPVRIVPTGDGLAACQPAFAPRLARDPAGRSRET